MTETAGAMTSRWSLTAPETSVLLAEPRSKSNEPFKLALVELIARGIYRLEMDSKPRAFFSSSARAYLVTGRNASRPKEYALRTVYDLIEDLPAKPPSSGRPGVPLFDVAYAVERRFGSLSGYGTCCVWPSLCQRSLAEQHTDRLLLFFRVFRYSLTPKGEVARDQARIVLDTAERSFHRLVLFDLPAAVAFAEMSGSALLVSSELYPDLAAVAEYLSAKVGRSGTESSQSAADAEAVPYHGLLLDPASLEGIAFLSGEVDQVQEVLDSN